MNRRNFIGTSAAAGAGALVLSQAGCNPKNLSPYVQTIIGALEEVAPLLPGVSGKITAAIKVARDFDAAYKRGDFASATQIFESLAVNVSQIITDVGVNLSPEIKAGLAVVGIALRAIAVLLKSQSEQPVVAKAISRAKTSSAPPPPSAENRILTLADPAALDKAFQAAKP